MKIDNFELLIGSPVDREKLVCEIYFENEIFAEISHETGDFLIEIYPHPKNKWWSLSLDKLQEIIFIGKQHLLGTYKIE